MVQSLPITRAKIDPTGQVLAVARGASLLLFVASSGAPIATSGTQHSATIRSIAFAKSGTILVSAGDDKQVIVWASGADGWKNIASVKAPKKMTSAQLSLDEAHLIFADKLGDVLQVPITFSPDLHEATIPAQPQIILGHYSSISSMTLSTDGKYIITGDKDEHVRVSHYPLSFDIESFCLGHTEFISGFVLSKQNPDILVSGSGDGTLRLWRMSTGKLLDTVFIGDNKEKKSEDADTIIPLDIYEPTQTVVVGVEEKPEVYLFNVSGDKLVQSGSVQLKAPVGSASFDTHGNIWASYLPINLLHRHLEESEGTSTATSSTPSSTSSAPSSSSSSSSIPSSSSSSSTPESKLVFLKSENGKYHTVEDSENIAAINKQFTDTVAQHDFYSALHELSKNFQFRKRFGDGEFAMGNNFNNAESMKKGKRDQQQGKKAKLQESDKSEKGEKKETSAPVLPNFVPQ